jgi:hypothetical protein
MVGRHLLMIF